jgi:protein TonB
MASEEIHRKTSFRPVHPLSTSGTFHRDEGAYFELLPAQRAPLVNPGGLRMNFALSQRRTDRHPVGLMVVVGLHVLLAGVLISARLSPKPGAPHDIPQIVPMNPTPPLVKPPIDLPLPTKPQLQQLTVPVPAVQVDVENAIIAPRLDDKAPPVQPPLVVASIVPDDNTVHTSFRVPARPARINAGAAQCRPEYPAAAARAGATGVSRIRFTVDPGGKVSAAQILQSSGATRENRMMDKAAAEALAQCPVTVGTDEMGRPVGATTDVDYVWTLNN